MSPTLDRGATGKLGPKGGLERLTPDPEAPVEAVTNWLYVVFKAGFSGGGTAFYQSGRRIKPGDRWPEGVGGTVTFFLIKAAAPAGSLRPALHKDSLCLSTAGQCTKHTRTLAHTLSHTPAHTHSVKFNNIYIFLNT